VVVTSGDSDRAHHAGLPAAERPPRAHASDPEAGEATKPAAANLLQQQARFDTFIAHYNDERPHQALEMAVPAARYTRSARPYRGLEDLTYPLHDWTATVTNCGRVCFKNRKVNLSHVFAGQNVGVKQVSDRVWLRHLHAVRLGVFRR
jgi:putative transposase